MKIEGVVIKKLEKRQGVSQRGEWQISSVVIQQPGDYGKPVVVECWGQIAQHCDLLREGDNVQMEVNIESREHNGRWYSTIKAFRVEIQSDGPPI